MSSVAKMSAEGRFGPEVAHAMIVKARHTEKVTRDHKVVAPDTFSTWGQLEIKLGPMPSMSTARYEKKTYEI